MAEKNEIEILVKAEVTKALTGLKQISDSTSNIEKTSNKMFNSLKVGYLAIAGFIGGTFVKALEAAGAEYADFAEQSAALTDKFGVNTKILLAQLSEASGGQISNFDLIRSASRAMALGVTTDGATLAKLLAFATAKSDELGKKAVDVFDTLVEGIGRGNARVLTSVGINKEAFDKQGFSLDGVTSKSQLLNIVLNQSAEYLDKVGAGSTSLSDKLDIQKAKFANLKLEIGEVIARGMERLIKVSNAVGDVLFSASREAEKFKKNLAETAGKNDPAIEIESYNKSIKALQDSIAKKSSLNDQINTAEIALQKARKKRLGDQDDLEIALERGKEARNSKEIDDAVKMATFQSNALAKSLGEEKAADEVLKGLQAKREERDRIERENKKDLSETLKAIRKSDYQDQIDHLDKLIALAQKGSKDEADLQKEKTRIINEEFDKQRKIAEDEGKEEDRLRAEKLEKERQLARDIVSLAQATAGSVTAIGDLVAQITKNQVDEEIAKNKELEDAKRAAVEKDYEAGKINADQKKKLLDEIDKEEKSFETEKKKRMKDAAIAQKAIAIAQSIINTAAAVVAALVNPVPFVGPALAIAAGITGAAQTALIAATPIPEFAEGGLVTGPFPAMVGHGTEAILPASLTNLLLEAAGSGGSNSTTNSYDQKNVTFVAQGIQDPTAFINKAQRQLGYNVFGGSR